jgi:hypothetical protein
LGLWVFTWSSDEGDGVLKADGSLIERMDESGDVDVSIVRLGLVELYRDAVVILYDAAQSLVSSLRSWGMAHQIVSKISQALWEPLPL